MNQFNSRQLLEELRKISGETGVKTRVYMIGGCSMSLRGLKPSTKDVDLIFTGRGELNAFARALEKLGYEKVMESTAEYEKLEAQVIYRKRESAGFDLFLNKVCGGLVLSAEMKKRAVKFGEFGNVEVLLCSEEDVFVFKSITERPRDVDDMAALIKAKRDSFDWEAVKKEITEQASRYPNLPTLAFNKLIDLQEKHEITVPVFSWLKKKSEEQILRLEFKNRVEAGMTRQEAFESLAKHGFSKKQLEKIIEGN